MFVVSVRFKDSGRIYYFDPGSLELQQGDAVIVETIHGPELAWVAYAQLEVSEEEITGELKPVLRHANQHDFDRKRKLQENLDDVLRRCNQKILDHNLDMRLVKAEYNFDGSRLTFYFTADQRVDFRMLVRDLARTFKTRIELRQIGPRDQARLLGGVGICGRAFCCATFLPNYARVSVKMAKDQELPLNPSKISGVCGRLLCCLSYEHQQYCHMKADLPRRGMSVQTPDGPGEVVVTNILQQTVTVQLSHSGMQETYPVTQIQEEGGKHATFDPPCTEFLTGSEIFEEIDMDEEYERFSYVYIDDEEIVSRTYHAGKLSDARADRHTPARKRSSSTSQHPHESRPEQPGKPEGSQKKRTSRRPRKRASQKRERDHETHHEQHPEQSSTSSTSSTSSSTSSSSSTDSRKSPRSRRRKRSNK